MNTWGWTLDIVILALAVLALIRYQTAKDSSGRFIAAVAAMVLGVLGLLLLAVGAFA